MKILENVNLAEYTSWLIGGPADFLCLPTGEAELIEALSWAQAHSKSVTVFSGGSNVLISDLGIRGLTICLKKFSFVQSETRNGRLHVECLSGTGKSELLKLFLKHQLPPALFLAGLPGDVGGGVTMNAGVAESFVPREFMELVDWIEVLGINQKIKRIKKTGK